MGVTLNQKIDSAYWLEVTEVYKSNEVAKKINQAVQFNIDHPNQHNPHREKLIQKTDMSVKGFDVCRAMANKIELAIRNKLQKTSYRKNVKDYGEGVLIVGLPLWYPVQDDFFTPNQFFIHIQCRMNKIKKK